MAAGSLSWLAVRTAAPDCLFSVLAVLESQGRDLEAAQRAGKLSSDFVGTSTRISLLAAAKVWRHAIETTRDPALGLRVASEYLKRDRSLVGYLIRTSPTLAEGLADKARFMPIEDELSRCEWIESDGTSTFRFGGSADFYFPRVAEFVAARVVGIVRCLSEATVDPEVVRFKHDPPPSTAAHRSFFRASLAFRADALEVVFPSRALGRPARSSDPALHDLLLRYAEQTLAEVKRPRGITERVRELLMELWQRESGALPTRLELARAMHVTPRTLSRWLEADGKTYSDVLDEFRALAATHGLTRADASLSELAQQLGFRDQSAFTHAFRRWTGMTPGQYRRLHATLGR